MFLMGLNICTKFVMNMFAIIEVFASYEVPQGERVRDAVRRWEGIQPKHCISDKMNNHEARNLFKWK